jgi:hypothetical protein
MCTAKQRARAALTHDGANGRERETVSLRAATRESRAAQAFQS